MSLAGSARALSLSALLLHRMMFGWHRAGQGPDKGHKNISFQPADVVPNSRESKGHPMSFWGAQRCLLSSHLPWERLNSPIRVILLYHRKENFALIQHLPKVTAAINSQGYSPLTSLCPWQLCERSTCFHTLYRHIQDTRYIDTHFGYKRAQIQGIFRQSHRHNTKH